MVIPGHGGASGHDAAYVGPDLHSIMLDPANPTHLWVGGHAATAESHDGGHSFGQVAGLAGVDAMSWTVTNDGRDQLVSGHYGVRRSTDGGRSWTDITSRLPASDVHAAGLDPRNPRQLWAYVVGDTIYSSGDAGDSWRRVGPDGMSMFGPILVDPGNQQLIGADVTKGVVRSSDGGKTWQATGGPQVFWITLDPMDSKHLLAVGDVLYQSHDDGLSWQVAGILSGGLRAVAISPADPSTWYAARMQNEDAVVLKSADAGATWHPVAGS